ncbi:MAG TPA: DNA gyrase inhibitor YacG [Nitrosomonas sp.]|nr:DNA gyrase inhibitor YacG [Nitrosomonas sp.]
MHKHIVKCPQCAKQVVWDSSSPFRPFCSERCKINDLSQWAQESYRIPESGNDQEDEKPDHHNG